MNSHLDRALMLFQQNRFELAEPELRQVLAADPQAGFAHALLALCLARREQFQEATEEARQAIHAEPDLPFAHYALASVLEDRNRLDEAAAAIAEAIRLDPEDADYHGLLAQVRLGQHRPQDALDSAERGLQQDAGHVGCTNLRAIALVKLGRKSEAGATIDAALAKNPENATTHANQGWTLLHQGDPRKALEHFREALRLDPDHEWARHGIIEALKARNFLYALMLRYFLWMSRLSPNAQFGIIIGGYFANRLLAGAARANPALAPWLLPFQILYFTFVILTWTADPLFNLALRLNRFGRLVLTPEKITASNWIGASVGLALLSLGGCLAFGFDSIFLIAALVFGLLVIPLAGTFNCEKGWPRNAMAGYTALMAAVGFALLGCFLVASTQTGSALQATLAVTRSLTTPLILGAIASPWLANFLMMQRRKR